MHGLKQRTQRKKYISRKKAQIYKAVSSTENETPLSPEHIDTEVCRRIAICLSEKRTSLKNSYFYKKKVKKTIKERRKMKISLYPDELDFHFIIGHKIVHFFLTKSFFAVIKSFLTADILKSYFPGDKRCYILFLRVWLYGRKYTVYF